MITESQQTPAGPSSWNLSAFKIALIGKLLEKASNHNLKGQYKAEFETYKQIEVNIKNRLSPGQKLMLQNRRKRVSKLCRVYNPEYIEYQKEKFSSDEPFRGYKYVLHKNKLRLKLYIYVDAIQSLLLVHKMDIASKDTETEGVE